jgi:nucleoid-associated protein EbfC
LFGNIGKMLKLAGGMKTKLPEMQERMARSVFTAEAGGGAARATVNGRGTLVELRIDPAALTDLQMNAAHLADLVKAAVSAAQEQAAQATQAAMRELTGGMDIPGLGALGGL